MIESDEEIFLNQDQIAWETQNLGMRHKWLVKRVPTETDLALGIFVEQIDILLRDAVVTLAEKGYIPYDSCQGHQEKDEAHIAFKVVFPPEIKSFFENEGFEVKVGRNETRISLEHTGFTPAQFKEKMTEVAKKAPVIGPLRWIDDLAGINFRHYFGKDRDFPPQDNPVWYREYPLESEKKATSFSIGKILSKVRQLF